MKQQILKVQKILNTIHYHFIPYLYYEYIFYRYAQKFQDIWTTVYPWGSCSKWLFQKFHRVFSDIKFYVNQTIGISCAGVMCMYSPGFSVKTTEDHRNLHNVKFCRQKFLLNTYIFLGDLIIYIA